MILPEWCFLFFIKGRKGEMRILEEEKWVKIIEAGVVCNLVAADDKDSLINPSYWIEDKKGERIGVIYYEKSGCQEAREIFNNLENKR